MKTRILLFALLIGLTSIVSCRKDEEDEDTNTGGNDNLNLNGSLTATIDGVAWAAEPEYVAVVITNFTGNPSIGVSGTRADSSFFTLMIPYFYGNDTTVTVPPALETELRFTDDDVFIAQPGTVSLSRTINNGVETYTGTFNGNFTSFFSNQTRSITNGAFTAKRLL